MGSLRPLRLPARAFAYLWLTSALPLPVVYVLLAALVGGFLFFCICLSRGGPVWDRWVQLIRLLTRRKRGR